MLAALESAPDAIFCLVADVAEPLWANARARLLEVGRNGLPEVSGRPVADLVDTALRSGQAEAAHGNLGQGGPLATVTARPMTVDGRAGALVIVEALATDDVHRAQLSLLPPSLPMLPDVCLSGSYHQASDLSVAGGDWYDAVSLGKGRLALVVGDAVGHGVPAAGAMSRLRGAMRSTLLRDSEPAGVVAALDAFAAQMDDVEGTSVFYGVLDAASGRLAYSAAGHPAPLVVLPDGSTSFLTVTPRPPLGSLPGAQATVHEAALPQGATLVLFSNGALAGTGIAPADALDRLGQVAREVLEAPGALDVETAVGLAAAIAEGVQRPHGWLDDVAVLVAHRRATAQESLRMDQLAVPSALPGVRRRLNAWLTGLGMGEQDRVGVMVAVGEACANAVEHAYRGSEPGPMSVVAQVDVDGVLTVTVRDDGTWRPPDRDPGDRGRGLLIMRQLVDGVTLEEDGGTTVTLSFRLRRTPEEDLDQRRLPDNADVVVDRNGERPVVRARGPVDATAAEQLRIRMLEASHGGASPMELDLAGVSLFSSAAVRVVLAMARIARDETWRLVVRAPEGGVTRHVLEISGLDGLVDLR
ncbi:SpoIIE family protein phosphatase [Blastococcus saxobsidens]|uniref:Fused histidine kinase/SpoIIE-like protein n=1 Tax=Blastococcus saxobsidens (strain DD2) TaxID=1146883 RepID=H6RPB5_BLASD|nr:SpoIIE family protein phosphatase [Blastococcus saxobsidens]CCG03974.1 Fused histidine kinase/SpoIIE-like protein [Blastococcus saxobsidens DD2]